MSSCVSIFCVLLWCAGVSIALQRNPQRSSTIKFSITSRRNLTGHWIAQVQFEHGANSKEAGPWDVDMEQTITKHEDNISEEIVIAATITAPPYESTHRPPGPPEDYKHLPEQGYYKYHRDPKSWILARHACEEEGAHLAIINSPREAMAVTSLWIPKLFNDWRDNWAYIGTHDLFAEGQWITIFNESVQDTGYNTWYSGEPDGGGAQNCGLLNSNSQLGNTFCSTQMAYICEFMT